MTRLISSNGQKFNNMDMFSCMDMTHKNHYRPVPLHRKSAKFIPDINLMLSFHSDIGKCNVGLLQQIVFFVLLVGQQMLLSYPLALPFQFDTRSATKSREI